MTEGPLRICVVDDDPFLLELWQRSLPGIKLDTFLNPAHFLDYFAKDRGANAYFIDYYLSGDLTGADLCRTVRDVLPSVPIFLFSDFAGPKPAECTAAIGKVVPTHTELIRMISETR